MKTTSPDIIKKASKPLTIRQSAFARFVAEGMNGCRAYLAAGYQCTEAVARVNASRLLAIASVELEVERLRTEADAASDMSRDELVKFLAKAIRTPIGDIDETSPLAQEMTREIIEKKDGPEVIRIRVKSVGKLEAARQLIAICGWAAPEKIEHSGSISLAAVLKEIQAGGLPCHQH